MAITSTRRRPNSNATAHEAELRQRIELARVILIAAIVFHHIRMPAELSLFTWDNLGYLRGYLQIGLLKTATSTLTIISGYLLFSSRFELAAIDHVRRKFRTLLVPLVLWNIPIALVICTLQADGHYLMKYDDLSGGSILNWANALLGLTREPADGPLHFLRNLFACNLIALVIAGVFRRYAVAIFIVILAIGALNLQSPIVTRSDIFIGFFLGALAAVTSVELVAIDALFPLSAPCFLVSSFFVYYLQVRYDSLWWLLHRFLAFLAVWPLIGILNGRPLGKALAKCSRYAFCLFLSHYYVIMLTFALFSLFFDLEYFYLYFLFAGPVTISFCIIGQSLAARYCPRLLEITTGGRLPATTNGSVGSASGLPRGSME